MEKQIKKRGFILPFLSLLKKTIKESFSNSARTDTFFVKIKNDNVFYSYFAQISAKIDQLIKTKESLPKSKIEEKSQPVDFKGISSDIIAKIAGKLTEIKIAVDKNKINLPQVQNIQGSVKVTNQKDYPFDRLLASLTAIELGIKNIKFETPKIEQKNIEIPDFPKSISFNEAAKIIDAIKELKEEIKSLPGNIPKSEFPAGMKVYVENFPPQKYPMPVTNISINALAGTIKSRTVTVTTNLTPLPGEVLSNRRSIIIYNNSSQIVEIGGSDFTFGDGLPIPANSYSPPIDAGTKMVLYGRVTTGTADVRTLETSDIGVGR